MSEEIQLSPTPRYTRTLQNAAGLAREMGHGHVGVEHLFLAIIRDPDAVPTQALAQVAELDAVEEALGGVLASPGYRGVPPADAVGVPAGELRDLLRVLPRCVQDGTHYRFNVRGDQAWLLFDPPDAAGAAIAAARDLLGREQP